jgi:sec-independent protein translocase protein TatB
MSIAGWAEILFIALLAFVIIGPKDLPKVLFMVGRFAQTLRRLSQEFMAEFETIRHLKEVEDQQKQRKKKNISS